ncbi:GD12259 [Drosophila simulans]|nr:GD12259 [Drosophila simulans]
MSSYRLNKELLSQAQNQQRAAANGNGNGSGIGMGDSGGATATPRSLSPAQSPQQSVSQAME